jgi:glucose/arabinose dehydrogenase
MGPQGGDEINLTPKANYGWPRVSTAAIMAAPTFPTTS